METVLGEAGIRSRDRKVSGFDIFNIIFSPQFRIHIPVPPTCHYDANISLLPSWASILCSALTVGVFTFTSLAPNLYLNPSRVNPLEDNCETLYVFVLETKKIPQMRSWYLLNLPTSKNPQDYVPFPMLPDHIS